MSTPTRIQRRRTKGWKAPEGALYVGRGSKWGNPFYVIEGMRYDRSVHFWVSCAPRHCPLRVTDVDHTTKETAVAESVELFERWLNGEDVFSPAPWRDKSIVHLRDMQDSWWGLQPWNAPPTANEIQTALRGKTLMCWCEESATHCHADVLLRIANEGGTDA